MDRKALIAIVLCGLIWAVWAAIYYPSVTNNPDASPTDTQLAGASGTAAEATPPTNVTVGGTATPVANVTPTADASPTPPPVAIQTKKFQHENIVAVLTNAGARPDGVVLPAYRRNVDSTDGDEVRLFSEQFPQPEMQPLVPSIKVTDDVGRPVDLVPREAVFEIVEETEDAITYRWSGNGIEVTRAWSFDPEHYRFHLTESWKNHGEKPLRGRVQYRWHAGLKGDVKTGFFAGLPDQYNQTVLLDDKKVVRKALKTKETSKRISHDKAVTWVGIDDRYFVGALVPVDPPAAVQAQVDPTVPNAPTVDFLKATTSKEVEGQVIGVVFARAPSLIPPGETQTFTYELFVGPKDYDLLQTVGYSLDKSLNLGRFLAPIATLLLRFLRFLQSYVVSWALAIVVLTLVIKGLLLPLTHKSMKMMRESSLAMQKLQPEINRLKEKYPDSEDRDKLNQETMALFQKHGVNPLSSLGGCVPMLLQMPIWFALYRVLYSAIDLRQEPLFGWVHDLSAPDPYYILPLLLGAVMFAQQRIMPQATAGGNETQMKIMKWMMPIMFTFIMLNLPSGLVLYIFINTCLSVVQSLYINKTMGPAKQPVAAKT